MLTLVTSGHDSDGVVLVLFDARERAYLERVVQKVGKLPWSQSLVVLGMWV